jgi:hypothetical protein
VSAEFEADSAQAATQIETALNTLSSHSQTYVNSSCGLHVHVGGRRDSPPRDPFRSHFQCRLRHY